MATLAVSTVSRSALDVSASALAAVASGGDGFPNTGVEFAMLYNGHATDSRTITMVTQTTVDGLAVADKTFTLAALSYKLVGPFPTGIYNDGNSRCQFTYSDSGADLKIMALKLGS